MSAKQIRSKANALFSNNKIQWFKIYILFVLISIIGLNNSASLGRFSVDGSSLTYYSESNSFVLYSIIVSLLTATIQFGASFKTLDIIRQPKLLDSAEYGDSLTGFSSFTVFFKYFLLELVREVFNFLWFMLFLIPGIIKYFSYSMADLIYYEALESDSELSYIEAITKSRKLMDGHKWELFKIQFIYDIAVFAVEILFAAISSILITVVPLLGALVVIVASIFVTIFVSSIEIRKNIARVELYESIR